MLYRTILCATDGFEHSDRAVARAGELARELRAELHVVHIAGRPPAPVTLGGDYMAEVRAERSGRVRRIREQVAELNDREPPIAMIPHFVAPRRGSTAEQLADLAERIDADLIVVGSRGRGVLGGALTGSTAQRLPHATRRAVLVLAGAEPALAATDGRTPLESIRHALHV
jgi:nucleotide-binding universal stress UspA family protein